MFLKDLSWAFCGRFTILIFNFLSSILIARYFGPSDYGSYQYVLSIAIILSILTNFGYDRIFVKNINSDTENIHKYIGNLILLKLIGSSIALVIGFFFYFLLDTTELYILLILIILSHFISSFSLKIFFIGKNNNKLAYIAIMLAVVFSFVIKLLLIHLEANIIYFGIPFVLEIIISTIILFFFYSKYFDSPINIKYDINLAKKFLRESYPIAFSTLSGVIYLYIDRVMLAQYGLFVELGIYSIYILFFSNIISIIHSTINQILEPQLVKIYLNKGTEIYQILLKNILAFHILFSIILSIFYLFFLQNFIAIIYGEAFNIFGNLIYFLAFNNIINAGFSLRVEYLVIKEKTNLIMIMRLTTLFINIILNLLLIPEFGVYGAALATSISIFIFTILLNIIDHDLRLYFKIYLKSIKLVIFKSPTVFLNFMSILFQRKTLEAIKLT